MDLNPMDTVESVQDQPEHAKDRAIALLNTWVALTVAILATFMAVCQIKDNNICQAMQQAQADKIDHWGYYQARNLREEVARATVTQLRLQAVDRPAQRADYEAAIAQFDAIAKDQAQKKAELQKQAQADQDTYDALNFRDDQFDLSDAAVAIAIALLAIASLTQFWWLYVLALLPSAFGFTMGLAGLAGWSLHPTALVKLLS